MIPALLGLALLLTPQGPQDVPRGQRRALLIGINDYENADIPDLRGCVNDVLLLQQVLQTRYGFDEIRMLRDREATRTAILRELQWAVGVTAGEDFLFVHYSGHGSQQPDQNGDETDDGLDETLVAADSRTGDVTDIVDDELDAILSRLATSQAVISFDACHSGTGTRALTELRTRDVPPDPRAALYRGTTAVRTRGASRYLAIASALPRERALDGPVAGTPHGLFSLALCTVLAEQPLPGEQAQQRTGAAECERLVALAYRDIVEGLGCAHRASTPGFDLVGFATDVSASKRRWQDPLLPLPRSGRGARLPWLEVSGTRQAVQLQGGARLGATRGSCWAIYGPGETTFARGAQLAWGEVTGRDGEAAVLELRGAAGERSFTACRAIRIAAPVAAEGVGVRLELPEPDRERARALLQRLIPRAQLVPAGAGFVVRRQDAGSGYTVLAGDEQSPVSARSTLEEAARVLARTVTAGSLLALSNPSSPMRVRVSTDLVGGVILDREIGVMRSRRRPADGYRTYREQDGIQAHNCLQLHIDADQECWLTVVNVDGRGKVGLLFPNELSEENRFLPQGRIPGGMRVDIPDTVGADAMAGFQLPMLTEGSETVRVFATADLATAERIRTAVRRAQGLQAEDPDAAAAVEGVLLQLRDDLLRSALAPREIGVMGVGVVANKPRPAEAAAATATGDWTAASISFRVAAAEGK